MKFNILIDAPADRKAVKQELDKFGKNKSIKQKRDHLKSLPQDNPVRLVGSANNYDLEKDGDDFQLLRTAFAEASCRDAGPRPPKKVKKHKTQTGYIAVGVRKMAMQFARDIKKTFGNDNPQVLVLLDHIQSGIRAVENMESMMGSFNKLKGKAGAAGSMN